MQPLMAASSCLCLVRMAQGAGTTEELYRGDGGEWKCGDQTGIWGCAQPWASGKGRDEASELEESSPPLAGGSTRREGAGAEEFPGGVWEKCSRYRLLDTR